MDGEKTGIIRWRDGGEQVSNVLGAVLVLVGAVGLAWQAEQRLKERSKVLRSLQGAVAYLEEELAFRFTPVPTILDYLSKHRTGAVGMFFKGVLEEMEHSESNTLRQSWTRAVRDRLPMLKEEERQSLEEVGEVLGQYDAKTQAKTLRLAGERLAEAYMEAQAECRRLGKVYIALGIAGGLTTVLILI